MLAGFLLLVMVTAWPVLAQCGSDGDGDGVCDPQDNCPSIPNAAQQDLDADGLGDSCDPNDDGDGFADVSDLCPTVADPDQIDGDGDGVGNACDVVVEDLSDAVFLAFGPEEMALNGYSLSAGDLNQDGTTDLLVGAVGATTFGRTRAGAANVFYGPRAGRVDLAVASADLTLAASGGLYFGFSSAIGDLTLDGVNDVVLATPNEWGTCSCDVCWGGLVAVVSGTVLTPGATINVYAAGMAEHTISTCSEQLGNRIVLADLDNDTQLDLISAGLGSALDSYVPDGYAYIYLNDPLDSPPYRADIEVWGGDQDRVGRGLASGDFNGDGIDDLAIGAPGAGGPDGLHPDTGAVFVLLGTGDGLPITIELASGAAVWLHGDAPGDLAGQSIAVADWNDDGFDDILVGAPGADGPSGSSRTDAGAAYLILGRSDLGPLLGVVLSDAARLRADGDLAEARMGTTVGMGDIDGDTIGDLVLGAPDTDGPMGQRAQAGSVRVLPGSRVPVATRIDLASVPPSRIVHGSAAGDWLAGNAEPLIARVSGGVLPDLVLGAAWADGPDGTRADAGEVGVIAASDTDGDGRINVLDCLPDDPTSIGLGPTGDQSYFEADGRTFVWSAVVGAESYTLYRGTVGGRWLDDATHRASGLSSPRFTDSEDPPPGTGYWYDSVANAASCSGPPGSRTGGAPRNVPE